MLRDDGGGGGAAVTDSVQAMASALVNANATSRSAGPRKPVESEGILGCIKHRLFADMIDPILSPYKILICDSAAAGLLSTCVRMHELMDHGVTLVEDLFLPRQPVINSPALYLIGASGESVRMIIDDWSRKDPYKEAHIFFVGRAPDELIQALAAQPRLVEHVVTLKDMLIDFSVPETLLFHLDVANDVAKLFPGEIALSGGHENILGHIASRLVSVVYSLGGGVPVVRYQASSRLAQRVGRDLLDSLARLAKDVPAFQGTARNPDRPLLILVDRSFDAAELLLHERTYQCLLDDLMPLTNTNLYEQNYVGRGGTQERRTCVIDEQDPYWCTYRHRFFATCLEDFPRLLRELLSANPALANGLQRGAALQEVGSAVRALPDFQEKEAKLSMHTDICTRIMEQYKAQKLAEVCELEQDIATERRPFRENEAHVRRLISDASVPLNVRLRLLLLFSAASNTRDFGEAKRQQLIQNSGLLNEASRCANLNWFINRTGMLHMRDSPSFAQAGTESASSSSTTRTRATSNTLRERNGRGHESGSAATNTPAPASVTGDPFLNQAYLVLEAAANETLSTSDFPVLNEALSELKVTPRANTTRRTLRMGLARMQNNNNNTGSAAAGGMAGSNALHTLGASAAANAAGANATSSFVGRRGEANAATLNLGFEGKIALRATPRIVLFILGGTTYGEARAAYDISLRYGRECIVGGTSLLRPEDFVAQLGALS